MSVLTLGKINGGKAQNIICEDVEILGTIRALNEKSRDFIINRARQIIENTAKAYGCIGKLYIEEDGYPPVINDEDLVEIVKNNTKKLLGEDKYIDKEYPSMGGEDFSFYGENCKSVFFHLGCGKEKGMGNLLHTDEFDIDEDCLLIGTMMHVLNVMYLNERS